VAACLLSLAGAARADETLTRTVLPGESPSAAQRLDSARKLARDRQFAEAVDEYQRLVVEAGDKLAPLGDQQFVQVRWLCHLDLAALPPEGLRLYRNRVDAQARKWFEHGAAERDPALLRRVVDEAFCSRFGDQALDVLGDLAFERGRFVEAGRWWRRIAVPASAAGGKPDRPLELLFPDPDVDVARVRAKQVLALLFQPETDVSAAALRDEVAAFRHLHPAAEGRLAGRSGKYADILQALLGQRPALAAVADAASWTSYGGGPARNLVLPPEPSDPNRLAGLVRRWRFSLETHAPLDDNDPLHDRAPSVANARSLAFHPLIAGGQALVADARGVTAYDLRRGTSSVWYQAPRQAGLNPAVALPAAPDLSYTLTVADGCVFARLGAQALAPGKENDGRDCASLLVCLGLKPDARGERLRWEVRPDAVNRECAVFEGAPAVSDGRVYVAVTRFAGGRNITAVHCYPVHAENAPPLRWRQDVCETGELTAERPRLRHHLLTLAGPNVVYCSHSGAIVALDAATGRHVWARRYPSRGLGDPDDPSPRGLTPCVYAGGRLYAAPADYDRLLCLDPATGQLLWERDKVEAVHLLGVTRGRLIFTTPQGIRAIDAATGADRDGWAEPDVESLPPFGRGFLAGDLVFWPTLTRLHVLNQADGRQPDELNPRPWQDVPRGNLVFGDGCLVVAGEKVLTVYVPPGWLRQEREEEVRRHPNSAAGHYQLALAEADAGRDSRALVELEQADRLATPGECWQGAALRDLTRGARHRLLFARADRAEAEGRWEEAASALADAAPPDAPRAARLAALSRQAALWDRAGQPARAVAVWQVVLADPDLRVGRLADARGRRQPAALLASGEIDTLLRSHGPGVYETSERQARALLDAAGDGQRRPALERVAVEFPNAAVVSPALLELARLDDRAGHPGAAAQEYRLALRRNSPRAERVAALRGLARAYEGQACWQAARDAWQELAREPGEQDAAAELRKAEYRSCEAPSPPDLPLPLLHGWQVPLAADERLLPAHAGGDTDPRVVPDCLGPDVLLFAGGRALLCRDPATGGVRWRAPLPFVPEWAGRHADTVLAAGPGGVSSLRLDDGGTLWSYLPPVTAPGQQALTDFRLTAAGLFFREGGRRLAALDVESGRLLWTAAPASAGLGLTYPSGQVFRYHVADDWLVAQVSGGKLWVLDPRTGRLLHELETSRAPWPAEPVASAERSLCLVAGDGSVALVDPTTGKELARPPLTAPTTLSGRPPQAVAGRDVLLLLTDRNFGLTLQRLDPLTGKPLWTDERLLGPGPVAAAGVTFDRDAVYCPGGGALQARALDDGRALWSRPLPDTGRDWRTLLTEKYLVAYPADVRAWSVQCRSLLGTLGLTTAGPAYQRVTLGVPVLFLDPKTGQTVQRLNLPMAGPRVVTQAPPQPGALLPQLRLEGLPVRLQLSRGAVVVEVAGRAWGRTVTGRE
jgi:outer membrane protein assembly factor BamB